MIHLLNGLTEVCSLPGRACTHCSRLCEQVTCKPLEEGCEQCGNACSSLLSKPLGSYVAAAVAISGAEVWACGSALSARGLGSCTLPADSYGGQLGIAAWLYVQLATAWLHLVFAPYIQHQLWRRLQEAPREEDGEEPGRPAEPRAPAEEAARALDGFRHVFWHDLGVCAYVLALPLSFGWSYVGEGWVEGRPACDPDGQSTRAAQLGMVFVVAMVVYTAAWCAWMECASLRPGRAGRYMQPRAAAHHVAMPLSGKPRGVGLAPPYAPSAPPLAACSTAANDAGPLLPDTSVRLPDAYAPQGLTGFQRACQPAQLTKLAACVGLDLCGNASYLLPALGEGTDVAFAPAQAVALKMLFHSNFVAFLGFAEEILPFTDIIPTATLAWCLETFAPEHSLTRALGLGAAPDGAGRQAAAALAAVARGRGRR